MGWLVFRQCEARKRMPLTAEIPLLHELQSLVDASDAADLTFLVPEHGRPFTAVFTFALTGSCSFATAVSVTWSKNSWVSGLEVGAEPLVQLLDER
jgi:hypothetical protein